MHIIDIFMQSENRRRQKSLLSCMWWVFIFGMLIFPFPSLAETPTIGQKQLSTYGTHSLAVKSEGTVWAWGHSDTGGHVYSDSSVQVAGVSGITRVAAGGMHSLAHEAAIAGEVSVRSSGYETKTQL